MLARRIFNRASLGSVLAPGLARTQLARPLAAAQLRTLHLSASPRPLATPSLRQRRDARTPQQHARTLASAAEPDEPSGGLRISHLFGGLVVLGLFVTIYGLVEWYYSLQQFPEPIRTPLKKALKAKYQGEHERADGFFREAIAAALSVPPSALEPSPLNKLSGIYISQASMLETAAGNPLRAYAVLREAFGQFGPAPLAAKPPRVTTWAGSEEEAQGGHLLTEEEVTRAIGLAQKLGQLAARMGGMASPPPLRRTNEDGTVAWGADASARGAEWDEAAVAFLEPALAAMLRLGLQRQADASGPVVVGRDVKLPYDDSQASDPEDAGRVNKRGLGITMETLAEVYARQGKYDLAGHLLIQAVSTLLPPGAENPPVLDRCQASLLMTSISSHALEPRTEKAVKASRSWSLRALQIIDGAAKDAGWETGSAPADAAAAVCANAKSVAQYNLGMLAEIEKQPAEAARHFADALATARDAGFREGKREAGEALRRVRVALGEPANPEPKPRKF